MYTLTGAALKILRFSDRSSIVLYETNKTIKKKNMVNFGRLEKISVCIVQTVPNTIADQAKDTRKG
jgi:hypothetical protein